MPSFSGKLTASHWGMGVVSVQDGKLLSVDAHPDDPSASDINRNIASSLQGEARVLRPAIRASWLRRHANGKAGEETFGDKTSEETRPRGEDAFVEVSWDMALDLIANELNRVRHQHGNRSIFAGSYGWSSAGRFHHAQSQLKRFLNTQGGFLRSEGNYSYNAALVLMPHILGNYRQHVAQATRFSVIAEHTKLLVMFGGIAERNTQVSDGGVSLHRTPSNLIACAKAGVRFVNISPLKSDAMAQINARWLPPIPGSDTAIMLALAHTLLTEGLHDVAFLKEYTVGFEQVERYILGKADGVVKSAEWASPLSGIAADELRQLARDMESNRTMISVAAGVQRTDYGEQPLWMCVTLAAMLGQIGLPGGGYTIGYGVNANIGSIERPFRWGTLPQGENPIEDYIPVAMISDMLLNPGGSYQYNGQTKQFPPIKMVWWAGGNPFHHHQDLNRLRDAFQKPDTIIVNEINWTSTARHADIVLPVAAPQERLDFGAGHSDNALIPMPAHVQPSGEARCEYDFFCELADKLGSLQAFSEGRSTEQWLYRMWEETQEQGQKIGVELPDWDTFINGDYVQVPDPSPEQNFLSDYRADPVKHSLPTPSGKIELYSETISGFNLDDCLGHASWYPPRDVAQGGLALHPLYLLSGQPKTRIHSQLDNGDYSKEFKIQGREPVLIHTDDALPRNIVDGDIVEVYNDRGSCLAGARVTDDIRKGCVFLWTGAWYDPDFSDASNRDKHGNPNVLTHDQRTSSLSQSPASHSALIELRRFEDEAPEIRVHGQPQFEPLPSVSPVIDK